MTDDPWRSRQDDEDNDFGPPLFADEREARPTERLSFGNHTGALPHWTEPPTGELPVFEDQIDSTDDLDVWSSFSGDATTWSDDAPTGGTSWADDDSAGHATPATQVVPAVPAAPAPTPAPVRAERDADRGDRGAARRQARRQPQPLSDDFADLADLDDLSPTFEPDTAPPVAAGRLDDSDAYDGDLGDVPEFDEPAPAPRRREPGRITIGTDPTDGAMSRPGPPARRPRPSDGPQRGGRPPARPAAGRGPGGRPGGRPAAPARGGVGGRDMPTAIGVGLGIAIVFIAALKMGAALTAVIVVAVLGLASIEFFDRVREKGYQPAFIPGIMACVAAPVAVYHYGVGALPLVMVLTFVACAVSFVGAQGLDSNPMPNMAITTLGVAWIGVLGSFGAAILGMSHSTGSANVGTDTLLLLAVGVVANDVGALFVGSAVGRTPLRPWISPNKSVEGFIGGTVMTLGVMLLIGIVGFGDTWNSVGELLLLGIVVSILAPIGDLTESMFKRNLDVKDFGSIVRGHGGVLDRFDGFLFVMPAVYYLLVYLQPWLSK